jgi:hypothetical protein
MSDAEGPWWRRIQWIDIVLVVVALAIALMLTMELWLPHYGSK